MSTSGKQVVASKNEQIAAQGTMERGNPYGLE